VRRRACKLLEQSINNALDNHLFNVVVAINFLGAGKYYYGPRVTFMELTVWSYRCYGEAEFIFRINQGGDIVGESIYHSFEHAIHPSPRSRFIFWALSLTRRRPNMIVGVPLLEESGAFAQFDGIDGPKVVSWAGGVMTQPLCVPWDRNRCCK